MQVSVNLAHLAMNQIKVIIIAFLLLSSCVEVEFKHPMPPKGKVLKAIPSEVIDYYTALEKKLTSEDKVRDIREDDFDINAPLPENVVFKEWKSDYYFNQKGENGNWQIYIVKSAPNNSYEVYQLDGTNQTTIDKLKAITKVKEVFSDDGDLDRIIINPSFKEFKKILKSGAFEKVDFFDN